MDDHLTPHQREARWRFQVLYVESLAEYLGTPQFSRLPDQLQREAIQQFREAIAELRQLSNVPLAGSEPDPHKVDDVCRRLIGEKEPRG
jgi:hypothetical protein